MASVVTIGYYAPSNLNVLEEVRKMLEEDFDLKGYKFNHTIFIPSSDENIKHLKEIKTLFLLNNDTISVTLHGKVYNMIRIGKGNES
jgi:hypothetical protein